MSVPEGAPSGDPAREAIDSLRGYVYQIYQSALAWTEIKDDEFLYLEVAEDFAIVAADALKAVQVKETAKRVSINSDDIVASIDSFIELQEKNPSLKVSLRHLTTSTITKEKSPKDRIGETPTLIMWRNLAKAGELSELRRILDNSKISEKSKRYIGDLSDPDFREKVLKKIHFDCGALGTQFLTRQLSSRVSKLVIERGGVHSQEVNCTANILLSLLKLSTNKNRDARFVDRNGLEKHLEEATQVTMNRVQFEAQNRLLEKALSSSLSAGADLSGSQSVKPCPVSDVPLPKALANRNDDVEQLMQSLDCSGISWISGAAGMGKTVAARVLAYENGGAWASINLRGQASEQVSLTLSEAANALPSFGLRGLIIDDLDCSLEPSALDNLHYLFHSANRSDVLLVVTSSKPPTNEFLFASGLKADITISLTEFNKKDIEEILEKIGISSSQSWANYIHLVSGGGHPQLAFAFIQSMAASGWDPKELQTLDGLIAGTPAVDEVRKRTRERLLRDLPDTARRLIERLSLKVGGFSRELAIDLGKVTPTIQGAGIVLDNLAGSWIDQHEGDRFSLSPLLSDYAMKTLTADEKETIQSVIAESLTKGHSLNVIDMNSALLAALSSRNKTVIIKLCMAVFGASHDELEMLATHMLIFTLFRTDTIAYPSDAGISHMFRGAQLLLLNQGDSSSNIEDALRCFSEEAENVQDEAKRSIINLLVYMKLLFNTSNSRLGLNFVGIIRELDQLLQNENNAIPTEALESFDSIQDEGIDPIGFMFLNQARLLTKIEELPSVFNFLDSSSPELRSRMLTPFDSDDFDVDMLVTGAWLCEHKNNTIDPLPHSTIFASLEKQAAGWNRTDLAICCRKFQAIILDEYGNDKESALSILDEGMAIYGQTNSELVRAKAKILYRSEDHKGSLALSKTLIESDAPLNEVEKAFLGRDAAICAEKQGDLDTARQYYLYGSEAANKSKLPDMEPMRVGLLADAALASWNNGDRLTCLQDFVTVLSELNKFVPDESLRTSHCHALTRHVLLWLDQDATGEFHLLENGEESTIYPGCVSNPEPHSEIGERDVTPIEIAWYMLAKIENHASLDAGITENLERFLPNGPVLEGPIILVPAKIYKAMTRLEIKLFIDALKETVSYITFTQASGDGFGGFDINNLSYGTFPLATIDQQEKLRELSEQFVLLYFAMCILKDDAASIPYALKQLGASSGFAVRQELLDCLESSGPVDDFYTDFAQLIAEHASSSSGGQIVEPRQVFDLALKVLQTAQTTGYCRLFSESLLPWLEKKWDFIRQHQRFLLNNPSQHEAVIDDVIEKKDVSANVKLVELLSVILPTLGISNQKKLEKILSSLPTL